MVMKKILIHPAYFPSIAQMVAIVNADGVIFEVQDNYQKQTYRNRAYIAHSNGKLLLTIPVEHRKNGQRQKTNEVLMANQFPWRKQHWKSLQIAYRTSPFFEFYEDELEFLFRDTVDNLLDHNLAIFNVLCDLIGIDPPIEKTNTFTKDVEEYLDLRFLIEAKRDCPIVLTPYTQVLEASHGFIPNLSILDLLFNEGPNTLSYLESQATSFFNSERN